MRFANVTFGQPVLASDLRVGGNSGSRFVGANGEINANSKADLLTQAIKFMEAAGVSGAVTENDATQRAEMAKMHEDMIVASFADTAAHKEVGEVIAEELYRANNRQGFSRRLMVQQSLNRGQMPNVRMRMKNQVATVATSPSQVYSQLVRDNVYTPPEFSIVCRPFVEEREIQQSSGDVLNEKYIEAMEGTMVAEDRLWRALALQASTIDNTLTTFVGTMTPGGLMSLQNQVTRWNLNATTVLMANDLLIDLVQDTGFQQVIDQVSKHEVLLTGRLGTLFGMEIITDAYRHPEHRVLSQGELFVVSEPGTHGQYTDRGGITSQPIDISTERIPGRGWVMSELYSIVIANSRSVARGIRV